MRNYNNLSALMERVVHKYNQVESKKRNYGTDIQLTRAEIHTIAVVGDYPGINITTLAKQQGITKGAASQMIYKLVDKGLVEKKVSPDSDSEVVLTITKTGKIAYEKHKEYHANSDEQLFIMLNEIPEELYMKLEHILLEFEKSMDERLNEE